MDKEVFGQLITQLRKNIDLNQKEFAEKLNVTPSTVCKWARGINAPDITCLARLSQILEVTYDELLNPQETLDRMQADADTPQTDDAQMIESNNSPSGKFRKLLHKYIWHAASATVAFVICFLGIYLHSHPRFTVVDTRYNYNGNFGVTYEMAVVGPKKISADAMNNYAQKIRAQWNANEYATEAEAIDISLYSDKETASNWGITDQYFVLIKERPQEER
ncbi:MAG: helix-turn-helix transcriptional regulator [Lachnospiraceae bacterium]|nr:helix-turn-helix transcriptional regulator [Lachnospiraceae bacterium]